MRDGIGVGVLVAVAGALALTAGCAEPTSGEAEDGQGAVRVVVVPEGDIIPVAGGVDIPQEAQLLFDDCERQLKEGTFDELAADMERVAAETDDPVVEAAALLCGGIAEIDRGEFEAGLADLDAADSGLDRFPPEIRDQLAELLYRGQIVGHASTGDDEAAQRSLDDLLAVAPDERDEALDELCRAASENAACATPSTDESTPAGPTGEPATPTGEPATPTEATSAPPTS
ncbi:MAG: hypothetical protein ACR2FQ_09900 [Pseudonocardiaceae bacterium]